MALLLIALSGGTSVSRAQLDLASTQPVSPTTAPATLEPMRLKRLVVELADRDASVRERARVALMGMNRQDLANLRGVLRAVTPLSTSQASSLREIVIHVHIATEAYNGNRNVGFLGVKDLAPIQVTRQAEPAPNEDRDLNPMITESGVLISERLPGFCGYRHLDSGDVILALERDDARIIRTRTVRQLQSAIQSCGSGQPVTLHILRRGNPESITLLLSAFPDAAFLGGNIEEFRQPRESAAEDFWKQTFEPLLAAGVS